MRGIVLLVAVNTLICVLSTVASGQITQDGGDLKVIDEIPAKVDLDLQGLMHQAASLKNTNQDIEEDEDDRFITKRNGLLRPKISKNHEDSLWAEETNAAPLSSGKVLFRKKRCGGGDDDDDDDGGANRARYSRRTRRVKRRKTKANKRKSKKNKTTTVKVIQNGQVVSETVQPASAINTQQLPHVAQVVEQQQSGIAVNQPHIVHVQPNIAIQVHPPTVTHVQQGAQVHGQPVVQTVQQQPTVQVHNQQPAAVQVQQALPVQVANQQTPQVQQV